MTRKQFVEIMRALHDIQEQDIPRLGSMERRYFRTAPIHFLLNASEADAQAIWDALPDHLKQ